MPTLYVIHHSPWSERARWALLHHKIGFDEREHTPLVGELSLRMRAKNTKGKVSVPLLVDEDVAVQGSLAIGEWVDARGKRDKLFPEGSRDRIAKLHETLEDTLHAARERFVRDLPSDHDAQMEALPPLLRALPGASFSARLGGTFIAAKYNARIGSVDDRIRNGLPTFATRSGGNSTSSTDSRSRTSSGRAWCKRSRRWTSSSISARERAASGSTRSSPRSSPI